MATGTNVVKVHYGLSRRTIEEFRSTWDSHFRPTSRLTLDIFFSFSFCFVFFF